MVKATENRTQFVNFCINSHSCRRKGTVTSNIVFVAFIRTTVKVQKQPSVCRFSVHLMFSLTSPL